MAKILSIFSQKGGVGKTTLSVNISAGLSLMLSTEDDGNPGRVLLVDLDEQAHSAIILSSGFFGKLENLDLNPDENIERSFCQYLEQEQFYKPGLDALLPHPPLFHF